MIPLQIVKHDNWFRDFCVDMGRRGPTHLRDMSNHCPVDNTSNVFCWFNDYHKQTHHKPIEEIDKSSPFTYIISIDGCDEDTLSELMYYGREMLLQNLVRSPINDDAKHELKTNPKASIVIENSAEGHASFQLFNSIHVLVALLDVPYHKVFYTNSTSNITECYERYLLDRPYALIEKINVFGSGEWTEQVCQLILQDVYELEQQDDFCEWGIELPYEQTSKMSVTPMSTSYLDGVTPDLKRPHLFMFKHMNAKRGHRTAFLSLLNSKGLLDNNMFSTPNDWNSTFMCCEEYLRENFWDKRQIEFYLQYLEMLHNLKPKVPTFIDREHNLLDFDPNTNFSSDQQMYFNARRNCDIEIIGESEFNGSRFITEKFFKAVIFKQPFIMLGTAGTLDEIVRGMGYRSFAPFINEGYDGNDDTKQRMEMIAEEISRLTEIKKDPVKWKEWNEGVQHIVTYNYNAYVNNLRKLSEIDSLEMKISRIGGLQQATDEMINR
tara:strand:+ start:10724 stop:12202 length:1479 start_codon:yes stop_codon:yes gene_type:complete